MSGLPSGVLERLRELPEGLQGHVQRVREVAVELARRHRVDAALVDLGAAAHDVARATNGAALLEEARRLGLAIHPVEREAPFLLLGPVAAAWLEQENTIADPRVLEAIRWHTVGRRAMGTVAKVVFLADKLDPEKVACSANLGVVAALARESLDRALLEYLNQEMLSILRRGGLVHPECLELRNELQMLRERAVVCIGPDSSAPRLGEHTGSPLPRNIT